MKREKSLPVILTLVCLPFLLGHAREGEVTLTSPLDIQSWTERWPTADGSIETRQVTSIIWNAAIQATLDRDQWAHLPRLDRPYYLDGPIILKSGQRLTADGDAEIRLKPGTNTCMVRNENVSGFRDGPVPADVKLDTDLLIEGGIWTTLWTAPGEDNGNPRGHSAQTKPVPGTHGVILLHNVRRVVVRNVTVRQSRAFGVHLGNARDFTVDGVTLDRHGRDGVHVNGPASDGRILRVTGDSHDDTVALNAWEWQNYAVAFGPIERITVEQVSGAPEKKKATDAIRLLPGVKRFADGSTLDCHLSDITLRDITDIRDFKLYDQPNLEMGRDRDASAGLGTLRNIRFENLVFNRLGSIQVHAHTDGLTIQNAMINVEAAASYRLLEIGPKSQTYKPKADDPATWVEIFSPDLDCLVRNVKLSGITMKGVPDEAPEERVVRVVQLQPNPGYPQTTPRGGTGKGVWIR